MRRYASLRRRSEFARLQRHGRRRGGRHLVLLSAEGPSPTKVGITIAKTVGKAVVRNRLRRRIKALLDRQLLGGPPFRRLLLIARPGAGELAFPALREEIERLLV